MTITIHASPVALAVACAILVLFLIIVRRRR